MHVAVYLGLLTESERVLSDGLSLLLSRQSGSSDATARSFFIQSQEHVEALVPFVKLYGWEATDAPSLVRQALREEERFGGLAEVRDLHHQVVLNKHTSVAWAILAQAGLALHDEALRAACARAARDVGHQTGWLTDHIQDLMAILLPDDVAAYAASQQHSAAALGEAFGLLAGRYANNPDIFTMARLMGSGSDALQQALQGVVRADAEGASDASQRLRAVLFASHHQDDVGLLCDLHDLTLLVEHARVGWDVLRDTVGADADPALAALCAEGVAVTARQLAWVESRVMATTPHALVGAPRA